MTARSSQLFARATLFVVFALAASFSQPATAQIFDWTNTTGAPNPFYDEVGNWSAGGPPDDTETARFNLAAAYEVWWDSLTPTDTPKVGRLAIEAGDVTFLNSIATSTTQHKLSVVGLSGSSYGMEVVGPSSLTLRGIELESLSGTEISNGAELVVDGSHAAGSTLTNEGLILLSGGSGSSSASLSVENGGLVTGGTGTPAWLWVDDNSSVMVDGTGSQMLLDRLDLYSGNVNVSNGGFLQTNLVDSARVDIGKLDGATGVVTVDGAGSSWRTFEMGIGLFGGTGLVTAQNGGRIESEFINIGGPDTSGGFDSTGTLRVTGAGSEVDSTDINVGFGGFNARMEVENGGQVNSMQGIVGSSVSGGSGQVSITGAGSRWDVVDSLDIGIDNARGGAFVGLGGVLTTGSATIDRGSVVISGSGSSWENAGRLQIDSDEVFGESQIDIIGGGSLQTGSLFVSRTRFGEVDVHGAGSTVFVQDTLAVGGVSNHGRVLVRNGASFEVGGAATIGSIGNGNLSLINNGSFQSDRLQIGTSGLLSLFTGSQLTTGKLQLGGGLQFNNGTINVTDLDSVLTINQSAFNYLDPTLELDDATLNVAGQTVFGHGVEVLIQDAANFTSASVVNDGTINVVNSAVMGNNLRHDGYSGRGTLNVGTASVTLHDAGLSTLGAVTNLNGGTLNVANGVALDTNSNLIGNGLVNGRVVGSIGSALYATGGNLTVGDGSHVAGFDHAGDLYTGSNQVTILDANQARLGSYTQLGDTGGSGYLQIDNGAIIDFGENLVGYGTIDNENTLATAIINNGAMIGNSISDRLIVEGYVKGIGLFENVQFNGTFAPGLSPTCIDGTNFFFGSSSNLEMEIGGLVRCAEYDAIRATGLLDLDGTLDVLLINGFNPELGDSFDLFDWGTLDGEFAAFDLPTLDAGLRWELSDLYTTGTLSVSAVPEPNSVMLLSLVAGIAFCRRRRV